MTTSEEKSERFKRVAENRTNHTIESIRLLGNCAIENDMLKIQMNV